MDPTFLVTDIKEKETIKPEAPRFPQIRSTTSGFPEHKKRTRISAFKQKRQGQETTPQARAPSTTASTTPASAPSPPSKHGAQSPSAPPAEENFEEKERRRIDRENNDRLSSMSPEEIEAARQELLGNLDPSTLQRLLTRANLDERRGPSPFDLPEQTSQQPQKPTRDPPPEIRIQDTTTATATAAKPNSTSRNLQATVEDEQEEEQESSEPKKATKKRVHFESSEPVEEPTQPSHTITTAAAAAATTTTNPTLPPQIDDDAAPPVPPTEHILHPADSRPSRPHWPQPPHPDGIDPDDPDFLAKLHEKYFPSLAADPSKLAWMAPIPRPGSAADLDSPYHPSQASVAASALRFDFRGALLPPRVARALPANRGLHHHGEAPEAAGYTVPELARLARSAVPGQRCLAYQTLGRLLYRLGRGAFGRPGDDMADALWALVQEGAVLRSLGEEASLEEGRGHRSARAFAIEAVWLYEKGGWAERVRRGK